MADTSTERQRVSLPTPLWTELAAILGLGLYAARLGCELIPGTRDAWQLIFAVMVGLVASWFATRLLSTLRIRHSELGLLLIYVFWPQLSIPVAWAVGLLASGVWLWRIRPLGASWLATAARWVPELGALAAGLLLYSATVAPTILPADAGEFQIVGSVLGIAHPPGYPLYSMIANLASLVPAGDTAHRISLLSVVFASLTLALIARLVRSMPSSLPGSRGVAWAALLGAAALACSPTFWVQATTANIRSLTALFTAALLVLAIRCAGSPTPKRLAWLLFFFGLAAGHHSSLILLGLPIAAYLLVSTHGALKQVRWIRPLIALAASLLVLLYLPIRSAMAPAFDPVPVTSVARFLDHVLALGFRGDMLYLDSLASLWERCLVYVEILRLQFGGWLPVAMLLGLAGVLWRNWRLGVLLGGVWLVNALSAITYRAPQTVEYLIPSYVAMAASLGCGLRLVVERLPNLRRTGLMLSLVSVLLVRQVALLWPDMLLQHSDTSTRASAEAILRQAPEGAIILSNWHSVTPLLYLQIVEGVRPDVQVEYVYPEGAQSNAETWLARVQDAVDMRPVLVTNRYYEYEGSGLVFEPLATAWLASTRPSERPPDAAKRIGQVLGDRIRIDAVTAPDASHPGRALNVHLYWRPLVRLDRDYAVSIQMVGPEGVVGQADRSQTTSTYPPGQMRAESYSLPLLLQTQPGTYQLIVGYYTKTADSWERLTTEGGEDHVLLGEVTVRPSNRTVATERPMDVHFQGGYALRGYDVDRTVAKWTRIYVHWVRSVETPGTPTTVVALDDRGEVVAEAHLPALSSGDTATAVLDIPGEPEALRLALQRDEQTLRPLTVFRLQGKATLALRLPAGPQHYVPLGGHFAYVGSRAPEQAAEPGQPLSVRPQLCALHPLSQDYSLSVGIAASDGRWEAKADGTPALGGIPTLKWLTGWEVTSLYAPVVPEDAGPGQAQVTLEAYDAFTLSPLAVLDERLAREGQGTYLVIGSVEIR